MTMVQQRLPKPGCSIVQAFMTNLGQSHGTYLANKKHGTVSVITILNSGCSTIQPFYGEVRYQTYFAKLVNRNDYWNPQPLTQQLLRFSLSEATCGSACGR